MKIIISEPLFEDGELDKFDNYIDKVIDDYTKLKFKEKEQILTQRIIKNQQNEIFKLKQEIKRLHRRNREIFNEMKNFIDNLDIENINKLTIFNHLGTYLLFNAPIRKSDKK